MRTKTEGSLRARQWGRAGPIMALVSVLIIAALAKVTLAHLGLAPEAKPTTTAERSTASDEAPVNEASADAPRPAPSNSVAKARAVQELVKRQSDELAAAIEKEGQ